MKTRLAAAALILAVPAGCARHQGVIRIVHAPAAADAGAERRGDYPAVFAQILSSFDAALGLPRPDVALVLFPGRRAFEQGLLQVGYPRELARTASAFNAIGGARAILMNGDVVDGFDRTRRTRLIAHELVHSMQYQLGGGTRGASEQWLREGFAEWVACRITAHLGLARFDSLRLDLLDPLAAVGPGVPPAPFEALVTFPQWVAAQDRFEAPLYTQAFVAAEMLVEMRGVPAFLEYFRRFSGTAERGRVFEEAFAIERAEFARAFARRWKETAARARQLSEAPATAPWPEGPARNRTLR
jgi:hypothetical protein